MTPYRQCVMLMMDGARADVFEALLAKGDLPHIARHVVEPGCYRRAVTSFPSTTGPAYLPFLTGCHPSTGNIPGLRWMEKGKYRDGTKKGLRSYVGVESVRFNDDMAPQLETLFEIFPQSYHALSMASRGVARRHMLTYWYRMFYMYYAHLTDRWSYVDAYVTRKLQQVVGTPFQFVFGVLVGVDELSHLRGPFDDAVLQSYRDIDAAVGAIAQRLSRAGHRDDTLWWLVSDHGFTETHTHFCAGEYLEARRCPTLSYPLVYRRGCRAANMVCGNGMTHLYFRHRDGWQHPMTYTDLQQDMPLVLEGLLHQPAVDILAARGDDGTVIVRTIDGEATLSLTDGLITYDCRTGDPLGLCVAGQGRTRRLSSAESLEASFHGRYPDAAHQLLQLFTSARTGDVVLSATPGFDLRKDFEFPEHFGSHGSLYREHMHVPLACSAPLTDGPLRTVDVFPTTLHLMGKTPLRPVEGVRRVA